MKRNKTLVVPARFSPLEAMYLGLHKLAATISQKQADELCHNTSPGFRVNVADLRAKLRGMAAALIGKGEGDIRGMAPFLLIDGVQQGSVAGRFQWSHLGLDIYFEGYGAKGVMPGYGAPVYIEVREGKLMLYVWADIDEEEPTHVIDLSGALEPAQLSQDNEEYTDGNESQAGLEAERLPQSGDSIAVAQRAGGSDPA